MTEQQTQLTPDEFVDRAFIGTVPTGPLADAIEGYAEEQIDEADRDEFISDWLDDDERRMCVEKAVIDCIIISQAAMPVHGFDMDSLKYIAGKIDLEERDDMMCRMKKTMLNKLVEAATDDMPDAEADDYTAKIQQIIKTFLN